ncbi:hypothetical protein VITU9109_16848 [Vibrio tubiashii ATCC 19109]|uniref:Transposase n=1 Tax=Vibrio tubiashii ATCC 19109 TaxID=1051646 RepID=A0ABP2LQA5_9VIBR|nr:hypothetical protein VITU9109_16848 [Vibrio tubiashii ATCC 19109]
MVMMQCPSIHSLLLVDVKWLLITSAQLWPSETVANEIT